MSEAFDFSVCTTGKQVPTGSDWLHEVKYDGYRMMVIRDGDRVRLLTKCGHDWSSRYPFIVETALRFREKHFVIDGEAVVLGGFSDFGALHSRKYDHEAQLYAFDLLSKVQSVDQRIIRRRAKRYGSRRSSSGNGGSWQRA